MTSTLERRQLVHTLETLLHAQKRRAFHSPRGWWSRQLSQQVEAQQHMVPDVSICQRQLPIADWSCGRTGTTRAAPRDAAAAGDATPPQLWQPQSPVRRVRTWPEKPPTNRGSDIMQTQQILAEQGAAEAVEEECMLDAIEQHQDTAVTLGSAQALATAAEANRTRSPSR